MTRWPVYFCVFLIQRSSLLIADNSCISSSPLRSECDGIRLCGTVDFNDDTPINCPRKMYSSKSAASSRVEIKDLQCDRRDGKWKSTQIKGVTNISGYVVDRASNVFCEYNECESSKLFPSCGTDIECKEHIISTNKLKYSCPRDSALWTRRSESESWVKLEDTKHLTCNMEKFWTNDQALPAGTQASCREPYVEDKGSNTGLYIALGVIGLIVIVTICVCIFLRKTGTTWHHIGFQDKTPVAKKEYDFNTPTINSPVGNSPKVKSPDVGSPHVAATPSNKNVSAEPETGTPRKAPSTEKGGVTTSADKITNEDLMSKEKINENQVFNI